MKQLDNQNHWNLEYQNEDENVNKKKQNQTEQNKTNKQTKKKTMKYLHKIKQNKIDYIYIYIIFVPLLIIHNVRYIFSHESYDRYIVLHVYLHIYNLKITQNYTIHSIENW
jgi:hypothetical protein